MNDVGVDFVETEISKISEQKNWNVHFT